MSNPHHRLAHLHWLWEAGHLAVTSKPLVWFIVTLDVHHIYKLLAIDLYCAVVFSFRKKAHTYLYTIQCNGPLLNGRALASWQTQWTVHWVTDSHVNRQPIQLIFLFFLFIKFIYYNIYNKIYTCISGSTAD